MPNDTATEGLTEDDVRELTDGLVKRSSSDSVTVYQNAAGVGCPNPNCDKGFFRTLVVSDHGWQELTATRDGIELCLCSTDSKRLVFVHDD